MEDYLGRVFYLGTRYHGSQMQSGVRTIQGELITAMNAWSNDEHSTETVIPSGRTDRGVHSFGQVVLIRTKKELDINRVNKYLPDDIVLWAYAKAPMNFKPRYSVLMRHYRYYLHDVDGLDSNLIRNGLQRFVGSHDYAQLSKPDGNRPTFATILNASMTVNRELMSFDIFGTNFLWKLVRKTVALMVRIGEGEFPPDFVSDLLNGKVTIKGGISPAPPEGLVLVESVIPVRMITSKYALNRIRTQIGKHHSFLQRTVKTLAALHEDFLSG